MGHTIAATLSDATVPRFPLIWVSDRFTEYTGYKFPDVRGRGLQLMQGPFTEQDVVEDMRGALNDGRRIRVKITNYRKDGTPFLNDMTLEPITDETGRIIFFVGLMRTPADEDDAEFEASCAAMIGTLVAQRRELMSSRLLTGHVSDRVLQSIGTGIIAVDRQGAVIYANTAALAFCERPSNEIFGLPIAQVLGEPFADIAAATGPSEEHLEHVYVTANGHRREAGFAIVRVASANESDVHCVFVFRDIGDRRQHELELRRLKGLTALGQMAAGFAHEVRNPLAALRSLNDCLFMELGEDDSRREYSRRISTLVARIESLVDHSLRYARPPPPKRSSLPPDRIVHGALETLAPRVRIAAQKQILVTAKGEIPHVDIDEMQMVQVLVNLLENAIDATGDPNRVKVEISTTEHKDRSFVRIDVVDDGPGLDDSMIQLVFDPFFTTKPKGTGLGLAIAQRLMGDNGGHLLATSEPDTRTVFSMLMPSVV